jgi:hypothetical protein
MSKLFIDLEDLDEYVTFGKYRDFTWREVLEEEPEYILWCHKTIDWIEFSTLVVDEVMETLQDL